MGLATKNAVSFALLSGASFGASFGAINVGSLLTFKKQVERKVYDEARAAQRKG